MKSFPRTLYFMLMRDLKDRRENGESLPWSCKRGDGAARGRA
jgi:hypothetical protein